MAGSATTTALFSHLLAQTRSNITFLISHNQISAETGREILNLLPVPGGGTDAEVTRSLNSLHIPTNDARDLEYNPDPGRAIVKAKALWGYNEGGEVSANSPIYYYY